MSELLPPVELQSQISNAIADAIMVSFACQVRKKNEETPFDFSNSNSQARQIELERWKKALKESLEGNCSFNSMIAGVFLADNYSHLFNLMIIVQTQIRGDFTFNRPFKRGDWNAHAGLVLEDMTGNWHYITPANDLGIQNRPHFLTNVFSRFSGSNKSNPLLTHITAPSLSLLMPMIEKLETKASVTLWPTASEIGQYNSKTENQNCITPQPNQGKLLLICKEWNDKVPQTHDFQMDVKYLRQALFGKP